MCTAGAARGRARRPNRKSVMAESVSEIRRPLGRKHLFRLIIARNWLAIGNAEEAHREFQLLPRNAQMHPQAQDVRQRLEALGFQP